MAKYSKKKYNGDPKKKQDPILVYDKNDPRLRAYNDSLSLYNENPKIQQIQKEWFQEYIRQLANGTQQASNGVLTGGTLSEEFKNIHDVHTNYYNKLNQRIKDTNIHPNFPNPLYDGINGEQPQTLFKKPTQPVEYVKPDYWNTDKDVLEFRKKFKEKFNEEPSRDSNIAKYDYDAAYKAGIRPVLDESDGLYHWSSEFKHDDHPNRYVNGLDTKTGKIQSKDGSFKNEGNLATVKRYEYPNYNNTRDVLNMIKNDPNGTKSFNTGEDLRNYEQRNMINKKKYGGPMKNPPKKGTPTEVKAYDDSLSLYNLSEQGLDIYKKGINSVEDYLELKRIHDEVDSLSKATGYKPTAGMPQKVKEWKRPIYGVPSIPDGTEAIGYSQDIYKQPTQPVELEKKKMGGELKYRKYGGKLKHCKFGDFLNEAYKDIYGKADDISGGRLKKATPLAEDIGKSVLNAYATPLEHVSGRNFYDPEYNGQAFQEVNNVASGVIGAATDVAGTYFGGPAYGMAKQGLQMGVEAADPNGELDNTSEENKDSNSFQVGQGISQLGGVASQFVGGGNPAEMIDPSKMMSGVMKYGGQITKYTGPKHEMGGIKIPGSGAEVEGNETLNNKQQYVYSDSITMDKDIVDEFGLTGGKGNTFASYSKRLDKKFGRTDDRFDQKSKEKMLERLTEAQESFKLTNFANNFENKFKMKMGGHLYKKYAEGGPLKLEQFISSEGLDPYDPMTSSMYEAYLKDYSLPNPYLNPTANLFNTIESAPNGIENPAGVSPFESVVPINPNSAYKGMNNNLNTLQDRSYTPDYNPDYGSNQPLSKDVNINPAYDIMRAAPIVANVLSSFKHQKLDPSKYKVGNRMSAPVMNINPLLADNRSNYANSLDTIKANTGGNAGAYLSNIGAINAGKYKADSAAYTNKFNVDSQNKMRADQVNLGLDQFDAESQFRTDDWNAKSSEMAKNLQRKAADGLAQYGEDNYQQAMTEAWIDAQSDNYDYNFTHKFKKKKFGGKLKKKK